MATIGSSPTAWQLQMEESDRRFYREFNDIKIGFGRPPVFYPCDPMMNQVYERTIFVKIHREFFAISDEILYEVFSRYGIIDWVERLSRGFHSTILFRDKESALWAFELLNGLNLYGDCCQLELFLAKQPEERSKSSASTSRDESVGFQELVNPNTTSSEESTMAIEVQTSIDLVEIQIQPEFPETLANDNIRGSFEPLEIEAQEIEDKGSVEVEATIEESSQETKSIPQINHPSREIEEGKQELQNQTDPSKVISIYPSFAKINVELVKTTELGKHCIASVKRVGELVEDLTDIRTDFRKSSVEFLEFLSAHKLFVKMPGQGESPIAIAEDIVKYRGQPMNSVFDPGIAEILVADSLEFIAIWMPYDRGKLKFISSEVGSNLFEFIEMKQPFVNAQEVFEKMTFLGPDVVVLADSLCDLGDSFGSINSFIFDPGGVLGDGKLHAESPFAGVFDQPFAGVLIETRRKFDGLIFVIVYDPGGIDCLGWQLFYWQYWELQGLMFERTLKMAIDKEQAQMKQFCDYEGVEVVLQLSNIFVALFAAELTVHFSRIGATLEADFAKHRSQWDPGRNGLKFTMTDFVQNYDNCWLQLKFWVLDRLILIFGPGGC